MAAKLAEFRNVKVHKSELADESLSKLDYNNEDEKSWCGSLANTMSKNCYHCWKLTQTCLLTSLNSLYDILTLLISIADVSTDVWVIYKFYLNKQMTFFIIAVIIMILAQLAYCVAFTLKFCKSSHKWCHLFLIFICVIPIAPFISFIFFFVSFPDNWLSKCFESIGLNDGTEKVNENQAPILVWIEKKVYKHMGYV